MRKSSCPRCGKGRLAAKDRPHGQYRAECSHCHKVGETRGNRKDALQQWHSMVAHETYYTTPEGWFQAYEKLKKAGQQILECNEAPSHGGFVEIADDGSILAGHYLSMALFKEGFDKGIIPEKFKLPNQRTWAYGAVE